MLVNIVTILNKQAVITFGSEVKLFRIESIQKVFQIFFKNRS